MDQRTIQILFALLRSAIRGTKLTESERNSYSADMLKALLQISAKHDVEHLLVLGLKQNRLVSTEDTRINKSIFKAVYRYEQLKYEYDNLCNVLEKAQIPFLPLKGAVIRKYYPEPWMRTSCDIDILVHEEDSEKVVSVLVNEYGYSYHGKGSHDLSLFAPNNTHVELHYNLFEEGISDKFSEMLNGVWNTVSIRDGFVYWHEMSDEMFYFYHIAHMAKHFLNGGCGIKPFIDLFILDSFKEADAAKRNKLLEKVNLLKFADAARKLSRIWLSNQPHDLISQEMEEYVLRGGVYGNNENRIIVQQQKKGGRFRYALSKIFLSYDIIKFQYPILQKHKWLTPIMQIRRWFKLIFCGHAKRTIKELRYNQNLPIDKAEETKKFLTNIGL